MIIAMAGTIGAGKTSLTKKLSPVINSTNFFESVDDNEILPLFYSDRKKYAFLLQIYFLNNRFEVIKEAMKLRDSGKNVILDRSIYEDSLLFHLNIDQLAVDGDGLEKEGQIYDRLIGNMMKDLPYASSTKAPDLLIYVKIDLETALKHIQKRGRDYEQIDKNPELEEYYRELISRYDKWYEEYNHSEKIMIDITKRDFVNNKNDLEFTLNQITEKMKQIESRNN